MTYSVSFGEFLLDFCQVVLQQSLFLRTVLSYVGSPLVANVASKSKSAGGFACGEVRRNADATDSRQTWTKARKEGRKGTEKNTHA